ncbi:NADH-quinone oxidoreductase subunit NuoE [Amaricoccus sp.]|uniref:NADH-quinone oxidoreductase subunit NuoE n=1 Tax=Amaricoccus sp. TaxID=1872485 RepID=UPI001B4DFF73|nr:NADH-quinone oxidoreductase subunit NuoE [Amaricoccus sp.]MBP7242053.1 NADH-quinone oxidoreductase subunit NuoE [Amaricoccus sp.]
MLRRLYHEQPERFAFTPANLEWAQTIIAKYPEGRQASAVIPLLWRAQEQEGWVTRPAIEEIARMLGMAYIRVLEVATFYFMFQLQPVGSVANIQICGTTTCMVCGSGSLIEVCKQRIAPHPHQLSPDGKFSWEEVECLGSCSNAPMAQIGKDYYEDLTAESFGAILDALARGEVPRPGPQNGRFASEPLGGNIQPAGERAEAANASVALALALGDTVARITGEPILARAAAAAPAAAPKPAPAPAAALAEVEPARPAGLGAPREGGADDLKRIKGVGPKLEAVLHGLGYYHFDQIAAWTPAEVAWVDANLEGFHGRVTRDDWVDQARILAGGGSTEFSERVDRGEVYDE